MIIVHATDLSCCLLHDFVVCNILRFVYCVICKHAATFFTLIFMSSQILLGVVIVWIITWILTACGMFTDDINDIAYMARADAKANIITNSKWFQLTYPGKLDLSALERSHKTYREYISSTCFSSRL